MNVKGDPIMQVAPLKRTTLLLLLATIIFQGGSAMAGIVFFENPPEGDPEHFNWHRNDLDAPFTFEQWLDITKPSTDQMGLTNGDSVGQLFFDSGGDLFNITAGGAAVAKLEGGLTQAFEFGATIDGSSTFDDGAIHAGLINAELTSDFEEGVTLYMGVQTESGNFGWIEVVRDRFNFTTTGWAYETEPGVPINAGAVPTAGGAGVLGLGLLFRRSRKRKR